MENFLTLFLVPFLSSSIFYVYDSIQIMEYLNKEKLDEYNAKNIIDTILIALEDSYAFYEISKNPPQPDFDKNYFKKVDIQKSLKSINTTNISFYQLYRQIKNNLAEFKDPNLDIYNRDTRVNKIIELLSNLYLMNPIKFRIKKINNRYELFCELDKRIDIFFNYFDKNLLNSIGENINEPIVSINNKDPFDFISDFCGNIQTIKNPHGTFSNKFNSHNFYNLRFYPISNEDLNMEIIYKNGIKLNVKYIIVSDKNLPELNNYIIGNVTKSREEINNNIKKNIEKDWDLQYYGKLKCKVDNKSEINIYYINTYDPYFIEMDYFFKCLDLFDTNNFPIVIIMEKNNHIKEESFLSRPFIEYFSPLTSVSYSYLYKISEMSSQKLKVNFGDNNILYLTFPYDFNNSRVFQIDPTYLIDNYEKRMTKIKKSLKNKRIPTDIIIFTDGALFSEYAMIIKYLQYYGGGIVVGYFGNPKYINITPFDTGQSISEAEDHNNLVLKSPGGYKHLYNTYNISLAIPDMLYFYEDLNLKVPIEYNVTPVDETLEIYEYFKDNKNIFIKEAKNIFNKYKKYCNPKNKKLVLVTQECDGKFENNYTYGGYECGEDGKWSTKCVPSYCDDEYAFNHYLKKCILKTDKINAMRKIVEKTYMIENSFNFTIILRILIVITIIIGIFFSIRKKNNKNNDIAKEEELIDISVGG